MLKDCVLLINIDVVIRWKCLFNVLCLNWYDLNVGDLKLLCIMIIVLYDFFNCMVSLLIIIF